MSRHNQQPARRRWFRFGPGTLVALAAAVAIVVSGWLNNRPPQGVDAGQIAYEADSSGHMRRVDAPSAAFAPAAAPLWKPEPALLLEHAARLRLDASQARRVQALNTAWQREKAELERAMSGTSTGLSTAAPGRSVSMASLRESMGGYSELSRQYDARRAAYWGRATGLLTAGQRASLDRIAGRRAAPGGQER